MNHDDEHDLPGGRPVPGIADGRLLAAGRRLGGRYRLERMLGHGGMAAVWLATDERLDRPVAIKVLSDTLAHDREYLGRFRREAQVAAGLQHPNLVPVYDFGSGERPYLVMEYIPGGDLAERIKAGQAPDAHDLAAELLSALRHIHAAGVLHRDIKPQNVLIDADGRARLTDFGIAQPRDATSFTRTGQVIGTESYLAPEVLRGEAASERSDLYALGVVLAGVGREGADAALWELTDGLRDSEPTRRPRSAGAALASLERRTAPTRVAAETTQPFDVGPPAPPPSGPDTAPRPFEPTASPVRRSPRRGRMLALAALAAVIAAVVIALALGSGGGDGSGSPLGDRAQDSGAGKGESNPPADTSTASTTESSATESSTTADTAPTEPVSNTDGTALNDQGFQLVNAGDYTGAIPILEKAVKELAKTGPEETYNYALYNLATAYSGAGQPEQAIPLLQQRLQYPDQTETVQAALDQACADAGVDCSGDTASSGGADVKPGKGPKKEKPPKE